MSSLLHPPPLSRSAKLFNKKRHNEKIQMKKTIAMHEEKKSKKKKEADVPDGAIPAYLMERCVFAVTVLCKESVGILHVGQTQK